MMIVLISCNAFILGERFFKTTAADMQTDLFHSESSSSLRLRFCKLAVHNTPLSKGAFVLSSLIRVSNENSSIWFFVGHRRQLPLLEEHNVEDLTFVLAV